MQHCVLLVDDDQPIVRALTARLTHAGYRVLGAGDAMSALLLAEKEPVDVAVIDINLPGLDGFQLLDSLEHSLRKPVPCVMVTANRDARYASSAKDRGVAAFLDKPFNANLLLDALADILDITHAVDATH